MMTYPSATPTSRMWKVTSLVTLFLITIINIRGTVTHSSIFGTPPPEQLFAGSDLVVTGKVLDINSRWGQGNESSIITVVRLEVEGVAKGEVPEALIEL